MREPGRPPPIRTDDSNAFANNTMRVRLPAIIDQTIAANDDYPASIKERLSQLRGEIAAGARIHGLPDASSPDASDWAGALRRQREILNAEPTWHNVEWFFAETYAYRCLIDAVRWWESGRDPFLPVKREELNSERLWALLDHATEPTDSAAEALRRLVAFDLWANRIDLSYAASMERGTRIDEDDLLVDERGDLLAYLAKSAGGSRQFYGDGTIYLVADNTGSELALDLALSDCLLRHVMERVVICLKAHPTFVSDATPADVWMILAEMTARGGSAAALAQRLRAYWASERLRFLPQLYWNSSRFLWDLPWSLRNRLNIARLVIIKGDANYRRALGDCLWPAHTPFSQVMDYLDAPVLCLRTLKSDPVVGLPSAETAARLERIDPDWRVNGKRGLIQFKAQTSKSQQVAVAG
ncbi:MAG: ARMT1-like domain-containing protein [Chloroflexota bacterium]|nr:ARMT1-like domain-containing protein [Chloroflexota bacterium]